METWSWIRRFPNPLIGLSTAFPIRINSTISIRPNPFRSNLTSSLIGILKSAAKYRKYGDPIGVVEGSTEVAAVDAGADRCSAGDGVPRGSPIALRVPLKRRALKRRIKIFMNVWDGL